MTHETLYDQDHDNAPTPDPYEPDPTPARDVQRRMVPGGSFILDAPDRVPCLWGDGDTVLWAQGESLILGGPPGVGKTTMAGQIVRGRLLGGTVLGLHVEPTTSKVLYLAMDRPAQIARALRRTLGDLPRELLDTRLSFWKGPPVVDIAKRPETLLGYAQLAEADTLVVDSLKDAALGLTEDEVGAGYNRARQLAIAAGVEVLELHHTVKRGANGTKPKTLADLYGSVWLTSGAGSVVLLWGEGGDPIVELIHLKMPAAEVGPFRVIHDHAVGTSTVYHQADLLAMARAKGKQGMTARQAAGALFSTDSPRPAEIEKARRRLATLTRSGDLVEQPGNDATMTPTTWVLMTLTDTLTGPKSREPRTTLQAPSRLDAKAQVTTRTPTLTTLTAPTLTFPSLSIERETEGATPAGPDPNSATEPETTPRNPAETGLGTGSGVEPACHLHGDTPRPDVCWTCEQGHAS